MWGGGRALSRAPTASQAAPPQAFFSPHCPSARPAPSAQCFRPLGYSHVVLSPEAQTLYSTDSISGPCWAAGIDTLCWNYTRKLNPSVKIGLRFPPVAGSHTLAPLKTGTFPRGRQGRGHLWTIPGLTDLVDEGSEPAVEVLDLLLLLVLHALRIGVDLQVEGREEALID